MNKELHKHFYRLARYYFYEKRRQKLILVRGAKIEPKRDFTRGTNKASKYVANALQAPNQFDISEDCQTRSRYTGCRTTHKFSISFAAGLKVSKSDGTA